MAHSAAGRCMWEQNPEEAQAKRCRFPSLVCAEAQPNGDQVPVSGLACSPCLPGIALTCICLGPVLEITCSGTVYHSWLDGCAVVLKCTTAGSVAIPFISWILSQIGYLLKWIMNCPISVYFRWISIVTIMVMLQEVNALEHQTSLSFTSEIHIAC